MSGPIKPLIIAHQRSFMLNCETKSEMESLGLSLALPLPCIILNANKEQKTGRPGNEAIALPRGGSVGTTTCIHATAPPCAPESYD